MGGSANLKPTQTISAKPLQPVRSLPEGVFQKAVRDRAESSLSRSEVRDEFSLKQSSLYAQKPLIGGRYSDLQSKLKSNNNRSEDNNLETSNDNIRRITPDIKLPRLEANDRAIR
jgi:hypothetical protein